MDQASVTRPPRLRSLADMRNRTSIFDRASSSFRSDDEHQTEISTERRAKVKMAFAKDADHESLVSARSNFSSRARANARPNRAMSGPSDVGSIISNWSKPSLVKPLFEFDSESILSVESEKSLFQNDNPWRAAKRGDLATLKRFQTTGKVDWMAKDEFGNTPLYYACHSGAIADIMVVPFLLWVTPSHDEQILDKCKRNAVNKQVRSILSAYMKGGISGIVSDNGNTQSVDSRRSETKAKPHARPLVRAVDKPVSSCSPAGVRIEIVKDNQVEVLQKDKTEQTTAPSAFEMQKPRSDHADAPAPSPPIKQTNKIVKVQTGVVTKHFSRSADGNEDTCSLGTSTSTVDTKGSRRVKSGSLKSMLFGERSKIKSDESIGQVAPIQTQSKRSVDTNWATSGTQSATPKKANSKEDDRIITPSRLNDESSFVKALITTRKPLLPDNQASNQKHRQLPPRPPPSNQISNFSSWNTHDKEESEGRDESEVQDREDWDTPIEQHRRYAHQEVIESTPSLVGRDEDSWSIASMLSLKKWRNNTKQLDPDKIDRIMFPRGKGKINDQMSSSIGRPSFDSISFGTSRRDKTTETGKTRGNFPKPYIQYHENEKTWVVGNQWKQNGNGENDKMLHVYDNRQRVHVTNCHGVNVHIHGRKMKAILLENSSDLNIIFDSVITTCEVVGCSNVGIQVTGVCPTFSIDTTQGVTVWLTREAMKTSNFVTSKSSDISISVPQSDDMHPWERKEVPLPVQFVHKFQEGGILSHSPGKF